MQLYWRKIFTKTSFWLGTEIIFSLLGIEKFVSYSEFIFACGFDLNKKNYRITKSSKLNPKFCSKVNDVCPVTQVTVKQTDTSQTSFANEERVFNNKCKQLKEPCIKVWCLSPSKSVRG
jgi:hypothetical protein